jgi:hypothetical protein
MLRADVGRSGCRNGTWSSSELADFLVNGLKTTKPRNEPAEAQSETSALPQIIDRKIVLRDDPGVIRGAGRVCARDIRSTAPSMFAPPPRCAFADDQSAWRKVTGRRELDSVGLGSVPDVFAERYEMVRAGLGGVLGWQCLATEKRDVPRPFGGGIRAQAPKALFTLRA